MRFFSYSPWIKIRVLCYQSQCHNCFQNLNLRPRRSASALEADGYRSETKSAGVITSSVCALVTELDAMHTYFVTGACI